MEKIRKGNDISILWEIMRGTEEVPYDLTGKDLALYIKSMYKTEKVTDFTTEGNVLKWTFLGKNQSHTGVYSLTLVENEGKEDMHTVDECHAFELVNCSSKVGGDAESHVQIKIVSLKSAILLSAILPDKELDTNSTNVVENGAIAREFEATNKRIDDLKIEHGIDIDSSLSTESENPVQNKVITDALNNKQDSITDLGTIRSNANKGATAVQPNDLSRVATSGSYNDLSNTPDIPSEITESTVSGWGFTKNVGTYVKPDGGIPKEDLSNTVQESLGKADTALQTHQDISHLATKDELEDKQESLVSGVNIKTINGESVLGGGNIEIKGGGESYDDSELRGLIEGKQDKLEDNVNIKTINGTSLLGSGNIVISGEGGESYDDTELRDMIANKVDKIEGKGLSTEDYTTEEKERLASLKNYDDTAIKADIESLKTSKVNKSDVATINGQSLLNGGNITISGGGSSYDDTELRNLIANKADKSGEYLDMSVGLAEDLGNRPFYDEAEFSFRSSAGEASVKDGLATIVKLKGNSVVWNQRYPTGWERKAMGLNIVSAHSKIEISGTLNNTYFNLLPFTANFPGHIYAFTLNDASVFNSLTFALMNRASSNSATIANGAALFIYTNTIEQSQLATNIGILGLEVGRDISTIITVAQYDLTQMFGAGNEPTTIEEFYARKPIVEDEYAYNEGEVIHMTAEGIKSVGDNAWDEQWRSGKYDITTGQHVDGNVHICSSNYIRITPNTKYYGVSPSTTWGVFYDYNKHIIPNAHVAINNAEFTTPSNAYYMMFYTMTDYGTTYNHDICIRLAHSGYKTDYEPYWQDILPLPIIRKYFPDGMKKAGTAYDEIYYDKTTNKKFAVQRIKAVKMKDLYWSLYTASGNNTSFVASLQDIRQPSTNAERIDGALIAKYSPTTGNKNTASLVDKCWVRLTNNIYIKDDAFASAEAFVNSLNDNDVIYYELAEPIVTELDAEDQNFRDYYKVADFGTEQAIAETNSAPISAKIEYGFGANDTIRTNKLAISALKKELHDSYATTQSVREAIEEAITTTLNTKV